MTKSIATGAALTAASIGQSKTVKASTIQPGAAGDEGGGHRPKILVGCKKTIGP